MCIIYPLTNLTERGGKKGMGCVLLIVHEN